MEVGYPGYRLALGFLVAVIALTPRPAAAEEFSVVSYNLNQLFDDVDDANDAPVVTTRIYRERLARIAETLAVDFELPHLVALQEVENATVLRHLANVIQQRHAVAYRPVMAATDGYSRINNGYLVHPRLSVRVFEPLFTERRFANAERLFSRAPLRIDLCRAGQCLTVLNLHLRSMRGTRSASGGRRVDLKRLEQAQAVALWVDRLQRADPARDLIVLGDFNALSPSDRRVDVAGIIRGAPSNARTRIDSPDLVERDLVDSTLRIPRRQRYSYVYREKQQQLDYLFVSRPLADRVAHIRYGGIDRALSDHAALYARFRWP